MRKHLGSAQISPHSASLVNNLCVNPLTRTSPPAVLLLGDDHGYHGKERKSYRYEDMKTPDEKLKSLPYASQYLNPITVEQLNPQVARMSDIDAVVHPRLLSPRARVPTRPYAGPSKEQSGM